MKTLNFFVTTTTFCFISSCICAEPNKLKMHMSGLDKDGNGIVSFVEFSSRAKKMFSWLDQDSNGSITREEMKSEERLRGKKMLSKWADKLDSNDDERIDEKEFIYGSKGRPTEKHKLINKSLFDKTPEGRKEINQAIFKTADKDKDGFLSKRELSEVRKIGPKVEKDLRFNKLDTNRNNRITEEEFISPIRKKFKEIDKNSDQLLDPKELLTSFKGKHNKKKKSWDMDNMWKGKKPIKHREMKKP